MKILQVTIKLGSVLRIFAAKMLIDVRIWNVH